MFFRYGVYAPDGTFYGLTIRGINMVYEDRDGEPYPIAGQIVHVTTNVVGEIYGTGQLTASGLAITDLALYNALGIDWTNPNGVVDMLSGPLPPVGRLTLGQGFNDVYLGFLPLPVTVYGRDGNDFFTGTGFDDYLNGRGGNDDISGLAGADRIIGGYGDDAMFGDEGDDYLNGQWDNDQMYGGSGNDILIGGFGNDIMYGDFAIGYGDTLMSSGDDILNGGPGTDTMHGGDGNDKLIGGTEDDILYGGNGNDDLRGGDGDDQLYGNETTTDALLETNKLSGGAGNDLLIGSGGNDRLNGGAGNDILAGGVGDDIMIGGTGDDILIGDGGDDAIYGQEGADQFLFTDEGATGNGNVRDFTDGEDVIGITYAGDTTAQEQYDLFIANAVQVGSKVVWTDSAGGYTATFRNLDIDELSAADFIAMDGYAAAM